MLASPNQAFVVQTPEEVALFARVFRVPKEEKPAARLPPEIFITSFSHYDFSPSLILTTVPFSAAV